MKASAWCGFLIVFICGLAAAQSGSIYNLNAMGDLTRFDAQTGRLIGSVNLGKRTKLIFTHGDAAESVPDGTAFGAVYDPRARVMYTIAPTTRSEGTEDRRFRLLGFSVPGLDVVTVLDIPAAFVHGGEAPELSQDPAGKVLLVSDGQQLGLDGKRLVPRGAAPVLPGTSPPIPNLGVQLDLKLYKLQGVQGSATPLTYFPVARCGDNALIRYAADASGLFTYAVVHVGAREIVRLDLPFAGQDSLIKFAPGCGAIYAQQSQVRAGAGVVIPQSGAALVNAQTGKLERTWTDNTLAGWHPLAVLPSGHLLLFKGGASRTVSLGRQFSGPPAGQSTVEGPSWFYVGS